MSVREDTLDRRQALALCISFPFFWRPSPAKLAGIRFRVMRRGNDRRRYIWLHGNEQTARGVLRDHMRRAEGRAFLIDGEARNVRFRGGELDPNRMFSREGAARNLHSLNPGWDFWRIEGALDALDRDRQRFLDRVLPGRGELLIALHNNGPGYSVNDEVPISNDSSLRMPERPREFMLCTHADDFRRLREAAVNVVLQARPAGDDDGSLSRLAAARRIRYVNIEAPHGSSDEQRRMLELVEALPLHRQLSSAILSRGVPMVSTGKWQVERG